MRARTFNIMQYEFNPKTGEDLHFNESNIIKALEHKSIKKWAYICHDKDVYSAKDEEQGYTQGELKPRHWHIVCSCPNTIEIPVMAKWFGIPENYIELPKGHGAFLDCVEYLTHEREEQQALGKVLYCDDDVTANFDFRKELDTRAENRLKYGTDLTPKEQMLYDVMYLGKTLKQCKIENPLLYMNIHKALKDKRLEYIYDQDVPNTRLNYYIEGRGGYGKDVASRALARSLFPQFTDDDEIFFEVGGENATFEGYDGQPVIIWSEFRAVTLLDVFKGRANLFKVFDSHPHNDRVNIKYGSIKLINVVNIVNSVQDYKSFLDGLAGEYVDKNGNLQIAEDKGQSYRRFPILMPLHTQDIDILLSKYFIGESDDPTEYEQYKRIVGNFRKVRMICRNNEALAREIEQRMLKGLPEKSHELLENEQVFTDDEIKEMFKDYGKEIEFIVEEPTTEEPMTEEAEKQVDLIELLSTGIA